MARSRSKSPAIKFGSSVKTSSPKAPVKENASGVDAQGNVRIPRPAKSPKLKDTEETSTSNVLPKPSAFHSSFNPPDPKLKPTTMCPTKEASQKASSSTSLKVPPASAPDTNSKSKVPPDFQAPSKSPDPLQATKAAVSDPPGGKIQSSKSPSNAFPQSSSFNPSNSDGDKESFQQHVQHQSTSSYAPPHFSHSRVLDAMATAYFSGQHIENKLISQCRIFRNSAEAPSFHANSPFQVKADQHGHLKVFNSLGILCIDLGPYPLYSVLTIPTFHSTNSLSRLMLSRHFTIQPRY
jgi:hypothetical protein